MFDQGPGGALSPAGSVATGGVGTGAGLGTQGAVTLSANGRWLLVVNAGSDNLTLFRVADDGSLTRKQVIGSHGDGPVSVAKWGPLVYVVHTGSASIAGFRVIDDRLHFVPGSVRPLSDPGAAPAQIAFRPGGTALVVTEKATNTIATFVVRKDGSAGPGTFRPSAGETPFGFAFAGWSTLVVSEAFGGAPDASATSSYHAGRFGGLSAISASVGTTETAACWVATTRDGGYAFVTNTGSGTISGYRVGGGGGLTLLNANGVTARTGAGSAPADEDFDGGDHHLYVLDGGNHQVDGFALGAGGGLTPIGSARVLPPRQPGWRPADPESREPRCAESPGAPGRFGEHLIHEPQCAGGRRRPDGARRAAALPRAGRVSRRGHRRRRGRPRPDPGFCADVVLLDLMLPGVDGLSVLRALRDRPGCPAVILLTARGAEPTVCSDWSLVPTITS